MAEKVVSIKIGLSVTQVAEVDYESKNPKVYRAFSFETPEDVIDDSGVRITDALIDLFKSGMAEAGIKNDRAVFTISSARVASRDVTIPLVKDKKIKTLLIANSKDYFPVDLTEYQLVYRIIEKIKNEKQMKLMVYAVPNTLVQSYQALAKALDLQLVAVDYLGNSIFQAMIRSMPTDISATVCVDDNTSMITVIRDGQIALQRTIGYGIDDAVRELTEGEFASTGMTYLDALNRMRSSQYIGDALRSERDDGLTAKKAVTGALTMLVGNVSRVLDYYFSRNTEVELNRVVLIGLGADCLGLDRLLSHELDVYVEPIRKFGQLDVARGLEGRDFYLTEYYANIGSAFKPLNISFASEAEKKQTVSLKLPALVCVGGIAVSVALSMSVALQNLVVRADNQEMMVELDSKRSTIDVYNDYVTKKMINQEMMMIDTNSVVPNESFLTFIGEMEEKMPSDLVVTNFSVENDTITLIMNVTSKASAAEALMQLRTFATVDTLSCSGMTEEIDDDGATKVEFSVILTYNTNPDSGEETTEDGGGEAVEITEPATETAE